MSLLRIIPKVFYSDLATGKNLFVDALKFDIVYETDDGEPFCIVKRDGVVVHLVESDEFARKDRPELRLATDAIEALHADITQRCPQLLHPNGRDLALKPWGLYEFALRDASDVCVIVEQDATIASS